MKPKGGAKYLVTNATLFKDKQFRSLVSKAANKELAQKVEGQAQEDSWRLFFKRIQEAIKRVGPRLKKEKTTRMDELRKRFQEISNKKTHGTTTPKEHTEWL